MKRYLLLLPLLLGLTGLSWAQNAPVNGAGLIPFGGTLPTTCTPANVGDPDAQALFYHTTSSGGAIGLYQCTATNTWTAAGGGVGTVTSVSGTTNQLVVATPTIKQPSLPLPFAKLPATQRPPVF